MILSSLKLYCVAFSSVMGNAYQSGHIRIRGKTAVAKCDAFRVMDVRIVQAGACIGRTVSGPQIVVTLVVLGGLSQMERDILEGDIRDAAPGLPVDQDAVLTVAKDIPKYNISDGTDTGIFFALEYSDRDGFGATPEYILPKKPGADDDIMKEHILDTALVPQLQGDAPVGSADDAVFDGDIPEELLAFTAEFNGGAGGGKGAVGYGDVLARTELHGGSGVFENDAIVRAFDVAIADAHILAVVRVNAVTIGHAQVIQDPNAVDQHILTANQMHGPESTVA